MEYYIPESHTAEPDYIPPFWISTVDGVTDFIQRSVAKGCVKVIGESAGKRPIQAVTYGTPRSAKGTTTFSGSLGYRDIKAYLGPDYMKRVYMAMGAVHGAEFEGIVGIVNLISVIEIMSNI